MADTLPPETEATIAQAEAAADAEKGSGKKTLLIVAGFLLAILLTVGICYWWFIHRNLNADELDVTKLTPTEKVLLDAKMDAMNGEKYAIEKLNQAAEDPVYNKQLQKEKEELGLPEGPHLRLTEKEINGALHSNASLQGRMRVELDDDTFSILTNFDVPEDAPFLAGNTVRANLSITLMMVDGKMSMRVKSVTIGGFPMPNAWLGNVKDHDLFEQINETKFGKAFNAGIKAFRIDDGNLILVPNE